MELELDRTQLSGYEAVLDTTVFHEETLEMIVPDACPDILRICDTEGKVFLKSKEAQEGRVEVSGTVRAAILYLPDGEEGMRRVEATLSFTSTADSAAVGPPLGGDGRDPKSQSAQGVGAGQSRSARSGLCRHDGKHLRRRAGPGGDRGGTAGGTL